jgi:PQQ-dependent catabolism-associated CXXCW motif protein
MGCRDAADAVRRVMVRSALAGYGSGMTTFQTQYAGRCALLFAALMSAAIAAQAADAESAFDPVTGYRTAHYRAAVPDRVPGGTRVDLETTDALIKSGAVLVDVMPAEGGGPDPSTGAWRLSRPHQTISGATWLPDVGRGKISPEIEDFFERNLERLSGGDKTKPLILFCQSDCWMAWNAVQRAASYGYTRLNWFPEGTDGWVEWGDRKLVPAVAVGLKDGVQP